MCVCACVCAYQRSNLQWHYIAKIKCHKEYYLYGKFHNFFTNSTDCLFLDYTTLLCTGFAIKLSDDVATDGFCPIIFLN